MPRPIEAAAVLAGFCWLLALWLFLTGVVVEAVTAVADESARLRLREPPGVPVVDAALFGSPEAEDLDFVLTTRSSFSFFGRGTMGEPFFVYGSSTVAATAEGRAAVGVASGESIRCFFLWEGFVAGGGRGGGVGCGCAVCSFSSLGASRSFSLLAVTSGYRGAGSISTSSGSAAGLGISFLEWDLLAATGVGMESGAGAEAGAAVVVGGVGKWEAMCSGEAAVVTAIGWIWECGMAGGPRSGEFVAEAVGGCAVLPISWLR